jgi:membrane-associated phospholipid phosphatase
LNAPFWPFVTRLGEAQILLPALLAMTGWLAWTRPTRLPAVWLACTALAAALTTLSKVAFIGWGIGYAPLDYTGISGHAMFAAAILPLLARGLAGPVPPPWPAAALLAGWALALVIAVSRVVTGAHSASEAVAGCLLGTLATLATLALAPAPPAAAAHAAPRALVAALALWLALTPAGAPPSATHGLVTRLALAVAGHSRPYTRADLLRQPRRSPAGQPSDAGAVEAVEIGAGAAVAAVHAAHPGRAGVAGVVLHQLAEAAPHGLRARHR